MAEAQHSNQQPAESRRSVVLSNYRNQSIELDPSIIIDITIHESLNQNTTHGEITILDIGGFEERIPIIGQEKINIKFGSSHLTNVPIQDKNFVIYNMSPKLIDESRKQAYVLFFVSEEYIANLKYKVSRSYKDFGYEIVKDIYFDYIQNNVTHQKSLYGVDNTDVDSTAYEMQLVMGMFRPFESINLVAKKSVSARGSFIGSKYMFFENKDGFHFKSIDSLISPKSSTKDLEQEEDNSTLKKFQQAKQIELENNPVADKFILMPANALSEGDIFDLSSEESIIRSFKFESTFDVIANIVGGMYNSRLLTYDPITMRVGALDNEGAYASMKDTEKATRKSSVRQKFYDYDYLQRFNQFSHVFGIANPMITKSHFAYGSPESSYKYVTTNFERDARKQVKILSKDMGKEVNYEMYLTNRTLPKFLNVRYLSESFGTVRYFLAYENINLQNNFMFNLYSIGMIYFILLFCIILFSLYNNFQNVIKITLILFSVAIASIEDLLPIYGLYLSLMFTMDQNEDK